MRQICSTLLCLLTSVGCASLGNGGATSDAPVVSAAPYLGKIPLTDGLDANGDGRLSKADADWFGTLVDGLGDVQAPTGLHYAGLKDPIATWKKVGFGTPQPVLSGIETLSVEERYGLRIDALYSQKSLALLKVEVPASNQPLASLALSGRFVANRDSVDMASLCGEISSFIPGDQSDLSDLRKVAVFDLDDTVWAGHIMDLGILAIAHGGLWGTKALDGVAGELGLTVAGDVIATAEEWVQRMRLPYGDENLVSRKDGFFALVKAMAGLNRDAVKDAISKAFTVKLGSEEPWTGRFLGNQGCTLRRWMDIWRGQGGEVLLVSATPDVFVEAAQAHLGQRPGTPFRGSQLTEVEGVFDGTLAQSIYATKGAVIREALGVSPWFVFGDSVNSDGPMYLVNFGWSFHVNPGSKFPAWDAERGGVIRSLVLPQELSPEAEESRLKAAAQ